jgi:hypothetical protein
LYDPLKIIHLEIPAQLLQSLDFVWYKAAFFCRTAEFSALMSQTGQNKSIKLIERINGKVMVV